MLRNVAFRDQNVLLKTVSAYFLFSLSLFPSLLADYLRVIRPEPGELLTILAGSTFVIGTVNPPNSTVVCNGVECDVSEDGAFIGFVPIRLSEKWTRVRGKMCDARFEFIAHYGEKEMKSVVPVCSPRSPSAAVSAYEVFAFPKIIRVVKDQWLGLEGNHLGDVIFIPEGSILTSEGGNTMVYRCKTPFGVEFSISASEVRIVSGQRKEKSFVRPWEISISTQKAVRFSWENAIEWEWPTDHHMWGFKLGTTKGVPHFRSRWQLRGDDKPVAPEHLFKGLHVCLDPGHHPDPGAIGPRGFEERESNLLLAQETARLLEKEGAQVSFTREGNPLPLKQRYARMLALQPDLIISIHNNSGWDGEDPRHQHGTQTFYFYPWSKPLAESVHRSMLERLGTRNMGCLRRNLYLPRFMECPTVLIEPEYIILPDQEKKFMDPDYRHKVAEAVVEGIRDFLEVVSKL